MPPKVETKLVNERSTDIVVRRQNLETRAIGKSVIASAVSTDHIEVRGTGADAGTGDVSFWLKKTGVKPGLYNQVKVDEYGRVIQASYVNSAGSGATDATIWNQNLEAQAANFWISGNGRVNGSLITGSLTTGSLSVSGAVNFAALTLDTPLAVTSGGTGTASVAAKSFFAGPVNGADDAPDWRFIAASDLPPIPFNSLIGLPNTLQLHGITDAYTKTQVDSLVSGLVVNLSDLDDVAIAGPALNQILKFNGTKWANADISTATILNANNYPSIQWNAPQSASMRINGIVQAGSFAVADPTGATAVQYTWQHSNGWFYAMLEESNDFVLGPYHDTGGSQINHPALRIKVADAQPYRADFYTPITLASMTPADTANALYNVSGTLYWNGAAVGSGSSGYTLPIATDTALGGIKVGTGLSINGSTGVLSVSSTQLFDYVDFNTSATTPSYATGRLYWDTAEYALSLCLASGSILQIGQELLLRAVNNTGSTIANGRIVYVSGAQGNRPTVALADATDDVKSKVVAVATQDVADNQIGFFTLSGLVHDIDTSMVPEGGEAWLSTTPGMMTSARPAAPNAAVCIGTVVRSHASVGHLFVRINRGLKLGEIGNVSLTSVQNGDVLKYNNGVWANAPETGGYTLPTATANALGGIKVGTGLVIDGNGVLSATGSAPSNALTTDTTQSITGAKNFSVTGALTAYDVIVSTGDIYVDYTDAGSNVHAYGFNFRFNNVYRALFRWNEQYDRFELNVRENNGSSRADRMIVPRNTTLPIQFGAGGIQVSAGGILISSSTPSLTTNNLYNVSGTLYWNGSILGAPSNMTTTDTTQTISGAKTFSAYTIFDNRIKIQTQKSVHGEVNTIYTNVINDTDSGSAWALTAALRFASGAGSNADGKGHTSFTTFQDGVNVASTGLAKARGFYAVSAQNDSSNSNVGTYYGYQTLTGSGAGVTTFSNYASYVVDDENYTNTNFGTRYGFLMRGTGNAPSSAWYGVYIEDAPAATTRYSIYTGNAPSRFGGGIELPSYTPASTTNKLYNVGGALTWNGSSVLTRSSLPSAVSTATEIKLLGFDTSGALCVWTWHVGTEAPTGTPLSTDLAFVVTPAP